MSIFEYALATESQGMYDITHTVRDAVSRAGVREGMVLVYCPHTTSGITINENADPDVIHDFLMGLDAAFPDRPGFRHGEGNSPAHLKASCVGSSATVVVREGGILLGRWQGIYFCEFDGPRRRKYQVTVM